MIQENSFDSAAIRRLVTSLKNVSHDEWVPPLLCFMNNQVAGLTLQEFLAYLEKITYQNWIRRLGKTKRNTVYYNVIGLINERAGAQAIVDRIKAYRNNEEFRSFIAGDVYGTQFATSVLLRIEQEMQDLSVTKTYEGGVSVEHVLPQKMTIEYWKERFSPEDHKRLIHKIGNLALLSGEKNSSARNYDFPKKKEAYDKKNKKVSFDLTKEVCDVQDWNVPTLEERQMRLVNKAVEIWSIN